MLITILGLLLAALLAAPLARRLGSRSAWLLPLPLLGALTCLAAHGQAVLAGDALSESRSWVPSLGVVLADNLFLLFVFWELTSLCSFLLIGLDDEDEGTRQGALLVTGAGGLALDTSPDRRTLFVHFMEYDDAAQARRSIQQGIARRARRLFA